MQIERINRMVSTSETAAAGKTVTGGPNNATAPDFEESDRLKEALNNTAAVRAEQVAKAKALAADPNYPSKEQLEKLAGLLADNWPIE
jgi:hypothetical protein